MIFNVLEKLQRCKLKAELDEMEGIKSNESSENVELRRDKLLLTDQVADLTRKVRVFMSCVGINYFLQINWQI